MAILVHKTTFTFQAAGCEAIPPEATEANLHITKFLIGQGQNIVPECRAANRSLNADRAIDPTLDEPLQLAWGRGLIINPHPNDIMLG